MIIEPHVNYDKVNQDLKDILDRVDGIIPIDVISGYRSEEYNKKIGGAVDKDGRSISQHCRGEAADIMPVTERVSSLFNQIVALGIEFDQLIYEFGDWVHISHVTYRQNRFQKLRARKDAEGKTVYEPVEDLI